MHHSAPHPLAHHERGYLAVLKGNPHHDELGQFTTAPVSGLTKADILKSPKTTYQKLAETMDANTSGHIDVQAVKAKLKEGDSLYLEMKSWPISQIDHKTIAKDVDPKRASSSKGSVIIGANGEIVDGRHRVAAAIAAGKSHISAWVPAKDALATATDTKKRDFFSILKGGNPYRDKDGKYTSKEKAAYQVGLVANAIDNLHAVGLQGAAVHGYAKAIGLDPKEVWKVSIPYNKYEKHAIAAGEQPMAIDEFIQQLTPGEHHDALIAKVKSSITAMKVWDKKYQKMSLDALDKKYPELLDKLESAKGDKEKKLAQKEVATKLAFWKDQHDNHGGDPEAFNSKMAEAFSKHSDKVSGDQAPKWKKPESVLDKDAAVAGQKVLGVHYYQMADKHGKMSDKALEAYEEWQKSKDYIKENHPGEVQSALSQQAKTAAANIKAAALAVEQAHTVGKQNHLKAVSDASSQMAQIAASGGIESKAYYDASAAHQTALKTAKAAGISAEESGAASKAGKDSAKKHIKAAEAFNTLTSSTSTKKILDIYDKNPDSFKSYAKTTKASAYGKHQVAQREGLTPIQLSAIKDYSGAGYTEHNKAVVGGAIPTTGSQGSTYGKDGASHMKEALSKTTLGANMKLRRNAPQKWFWKALGVDEGDMNSLTQEQMNSHVGKTYTETAFSSTSRDEDFGSVFSKTAQNSGHIAMHIRAHKDIRGLDLTGISTHKGEAEVVLDAGVTYVIRKIVPAASRTAGSGRKYNVYVDAIGHKD